MNKRHSLYIAVFFMYTILMCTTAYAQNGSVDALLKTGNDYSNLFQYDKAYENFRKATELEPDNWEGWFLGGKCLLRLKKLDEAERFLTKAHDLKPDEVDVQKALGSIYINYAKTAATNGQIAAKLDYQLKACHAYPAGTKIWLALFEQWWQNGEFEKIKAEGDFIVKNNKELLDQADDESLQASLVYVAKAYYGDADYATADKFLTHASKIRCQNDELYTLKREIKNRGEEKIKKILNQAQSEIESKNYEKAMETLKNASKQPGARQSEIQEKIEQLEKTININKYLEEIAGLIKSEKYSEASVKLEEALGTYPENEELTAKYQEVTNKLEEIQEKKEKEEEAKSYAEEMKRKKEMRFEAAKKEAEKYEKDKNYDSAIESLQKALKIYPNDGNVKAKIEELQTASKKAKKRQEEYTQSFAKLQSLFKEESYEECTELGESLLGKYAEHKVTVSEVLAEAYLKLEKYEEASKIVNNLENEKTQYEHLYNFAKGMEAYLKGDFDTSMPLLEQVSNSTYKFKSNASSTIWKIRLTRWQWGVYILLLALVIAITPKIKDIIQTAQEKSKNQKLEKIKESGNYEANFKFLEERYTKDDVHNMKLVTLLYAAALQKKGDNAKAYDLITDYLKKDSRSPLAKSIAGETAMALGETSMIALEQIEGLLKINENRSDVTNYLAKTYITQKADHKKAQEYIAKYISMNPGDTEAIKYLADVYISRQAYSQQSIKTFEKAIKNNPDISDYYVALMENHKAIGNTLEAERILETIKERFPDFATASSNTGYDPYSNQQDFYSQPTDYGQQQNYAQLPDDSQVSASAEPQSYYSQMSLPSQTESAQSQQAEDYSQKIMQQQMLFQQAYQQPTQQQAPKSAPAGFPNYDSIGGEELPSLESLVGKEEPLNNDSSGLLPDLSDLIDPKKNQPQQSAAVQPAAKPRITGPTKNCPHCGNLNSANEYYCTSCGKPF